MMMFILRDGRNYGYKYTCPDCTSQYIATHDEDCCDGDADGWKKPQCAQPPFFCPLAYVHEINVHVREDEQCDDECEYS